MPLQSADKKAIILQEMLRVKNYKRRGFNVGILKLFKEEYGTDITESGVSRIIKSIEENWKESVSTVITKTEIVKKFLNIYEIAMEKGQLLIATKNLSEIGKIEGFYIEKQELTATGITLQISDQFMPKIENKENKTDEEE
jgi:hypothetical protein